MNTKSIVFAAIAAMTLSACVDRGIDPVSAEVRNGPQTQSPSANAPRGKLPTDTGDATAVIIINDSAT